MNHQNIIKGFGKSFSKVWHNATKFGVNQILIAITLSSISGISQICKIVKFSGAGFVKVLLKLNKIINENAISATLRILGQSGASKLHMLLLSKKTDGCIKVDWKVSRLMPIQLLNQSVVTRRGL